jgi:hypothetical protein
LAASRIYFNNLDTVGWNDRPSGGNATKNDIGIMMYGGKIAPSRNDPGTQAIMLLETVAKGPALWANKQHTSLPGLLLPINQHELFC